MACMDTKGTESMDPSDEKKKFVAAGNHFKINCFIIAANKKILISAVLMTMQLIKFTHSDLWSNSVINQLSPKLNTNVNVSKDVRKYVNSRCNSFYTWSGRKYVIY